jgi:nucleoside-diphosphate-sugar epimerase
VILALSHRGDADQIFNLQSAFVSWEEIARMVVGITGGKAEVEIVPPARWSGAPFLADAWKLDDALARERLGYRPRHDPAGTRAQLRDSIARTWEGLRRT